MFSDNPFIYFLTSYELRLIAGLFLFSTKMKKREYFWWRILIFVPLLLTNSIFHAFGIDLLSVFMWGWFSFIFIIELIVGLFCVAFCFEVEWKRLLYISTGAYSYQNAVNAFYFAFMMRLRLFNSPWDLPTYFIFVVGFWCALYFGVLKRKWFVTSGRMEAIPLITLISLTLSIQLVYSSYLTFGTRSGAEIHQNLGFISLLIVAVLILYVRNNIRVTEKEILQRLLIEKEKEYRVTQETINLINEKSHDLKKILAYIEANSEGQTLAEAKQIEEAIQKYDSIVQTGNATVDIVVSEKKLHCLRAGINFSCVADGSLLNGMSEVDIYTLLTNALDNAIEATSLIEEPEKRNITLRIVRSGSMALLKVENSFAVKPVFVSGMPITSKSDKQYHGFGVQSIKTTVKKYGGYFDIQVQDGKFVLLATFPCDQTPDAKSSEMPTTR